MKHIHFIGIGGSGTSAAAAIAKASGYKVSGCDKNPHTEFTEKFNSDELLTGHSSSHLEGVDILAITPAVTSLDPDNEELQEAKKREIEILSWQQFMGKYLMEGRFVITVCGTHGKSTTTAMIGQILEDASLDPTVELGAIVPKWGTNYRIGKGEYFVAEADEFNDNFLSFTPNITVVTNIEMDHPEYFKNFDELKESFIRFLMQTKQIVVANINDPNVSEVIKTAMKLPPQDGQKYLDRNENVQYLDYSKNEINLKLKVPGEHNKLNALAAFQVGLLLGLEPSTINHSLSTFTGIGRRFEYIGEFNGAQIYSDFGHHPTEIKITMKAAREKFGDKKIWLIYQPHMFSRTKYLFDDFVKVFKSIPVDQTIITDIYPSREVDTGLVKSWQLVESIKKEGVQYKSPEELKETLHKDIKEGDILFFMGAGDIDTLARKLAG